MTTPKTWVAGETVTAAELNAEVRDRMITLEATDAALPATYGRLPDAAEQTIFVTTRGDDANDGLTLKSAKATIAAALTALGGNPGAVHLGAGNITTAATHPLPNGTRILGAGRGMTTITYAGTGTLFSQPTPGTRIYGLSLSEITITGPGSATATTALDLDSVSTSQFSDLTISSFGKGVRIGSVISGGAVYNTFSNVTAQSCTTGFSLEASGSNATRFLACRANACTTGLSIVDTNNTTWIGGQIESNTTGVVINATTAGLADSNLIESTRFEDNETAWTVASVNVRETRILNPLVFGTYTVSDSGARTTHWGAASSVAHSTAQDPLGCFRFERATAAGAENPNVVIVDSNAASGNGVSLQLENERWNGYFLRAKSGGLIALDIGVDGSVLSKGAGGIGYGVGAGGAVTQITSRATAVTINKMSGTITTINTSLAAGAAQWFSVNNTCVKVGDTVVVSIRSGSTQDTSAPFVSYVANNSFDITIRNLSSTLADTVAMVINFAVIKAASS